VPLAFRRRWAFPVLVAIVALSALKGFIYEVPEEGAMPFPALLLGGFSAALYARPIALAYASAALPVAGMLLGAHISEQQTAVDYAILAFISLGAWTGGLLVRRRADQVERALRDSGEMARTAVAEERARIARELHDVVAHSVSIIAVQAGAAERQLRRDPDRAEEHVGVIRRTAHETMTEMRRLLDVLRTEDASYAPQPGLSRLEELLEEARAAGLPVELTEQGERRPLASGVELAAFRIVQESLTNVRKHSGNVPTTVGVSYGSEELVVEVVNAQGSTVASGNGGGHGLIGMRERARIYGGQLDAGPGPDGGFVVRARLPLEGEGG
jgi:signal transduction histidine kinase